MEFIFLTKIKLNRNSCLLLLFILSANCFSQKTIEKEIDATLINSIEINSDLVNSITVFSSNTNVIKVTTKIEGEHYENVILSLIEKDHKLYINPDFTPFFEADNDKLAAHKVQSIEMNLLIPERLELSIKSKIASVQSNGSFNSIFVILENGNCTLREFIGNAVIKTNIGFIAVYAKEKIFGEALSKKGIIINNLSENINSKYRIFAESKVGSISLFQIH